MIMMAQIEHIKKMHQMEELSIRKISKRSGHHRDTIAKYLNIEVDEPPRNKLTRPKKRPVLDPYIPILIANVQVRFHLVLVITCPCCPSIKAAVLL